MTDPLPLAVAGSALLLTWAVTWHGAAPSTIFSGWKTSFNIFLRLMRWSGLILLIAAIILNLTQK